MRPYVGVVRHTVQAEQVSNERNSLPRSLLCAGNVRPPDSVAPDGRHVFPAGDAHFPDAGDAASKAPGDAQGRRGVRVRTKHVLFCRSSFHRSSAHSHGQNSHDVCNIGSFGCERQSRLRAIRTCVVCLLWAIVVMTAVMLHCVMLHTRSRFAQISQNKGEQWLSRAESPAGVAISRLSPEHQVHNVGLGACKKGRALNF